MAFYADLKITPTNKSQSLDSSLVGISQEKLNEKRLKILLDISAGLFAANNYTDIGNTIFSNIRKYEVGMNMAGKLSVYDWEKDEYSTVYITDAPAEKNTIYLKGYDNGKFQFSRKFISG